MGDITEVRTGAEMVGLFFGAFRTQFTAGTEPSGNYQASRPAVADSGSAGVETDLVGL